jgi:hypothetical protein
MEMIRNNRILKTSPHTCLYIHTDNLFEEELPTLPEHMDSPPCFSGVRVTRSLALYVCFVDR